MIQKNNIKAILQHEPGLLGVAQTLAYSFPRSYKTARTKIVGSFVVDALESNEVRPRRSVEMELVVWGIPRAMCLATIKDCYPDISSVMPTGDGAVVRLVDGSRVIIHHIESESEIEEPTGQSVLERACLQKQTTVAALAACPMSGSIYDFFGGLEDLENKLVRLVPEVERVSANVLYETLLLIAAYDFKIAPCSFEAFYDAADACNYSEYTPEDFWQYFVQIMLGTKKPSQAFKVIKEVGLIYRHFRFLLDIEPESRTKRWEDALESMDLASSSTKELPLDGMLKMALVWGAFLAPIVEPEKKNVGDYHRDKNRHITIALDIVQERMAISDRLRGNIEKVIMLIHMVQRYAPEKKTVQTEEPVFKLRNRFKGRRFTPGGGHVQVKTDSVETTGLEFDDRIKSRIEKIAPISVEIVRGVLKVCGKEELFNRKFFQQFDFPPSNTSDMCPLQVEQSSKECV